MDRKPFRTPRAGPTDSFVRDAQSFSNSWTRRTAHLTILMASYTRARISRSFDTPGACLARKLSCYLLESGLRRPGLPKPPARQQTSQIETQGG